MLKNPRFPLLVALALLIPACGGGGSDDAPPPPPATFVPGTYYLGGFEASMDGTSFTCFEGTITFDASGDYAMSVLINSNGSVNPETMNGTYVVGADRSLSIAGAAPSDLLSGGFRPGYDAGVFGRLASGGNPMCGLILRRGPADSYAPDLLDGDYHVAGYGTAMVGGPPAVRSRESYTGTATFDSGAGTFTYSLSRNLEGAVSVDAGALLYALNGNGALALVDSLTPTYVMNGGVIAGGELAFCTVITEGQEPLLLVMARKSGTLAASEAAGPYRYSGMLATGADSNAALGGTITFADPGGTWTSADTANVDGTVTTGTSSGTWSVTAAGRLSFVTDDPTTLEFGVLDGGSAAAGASITAASGPQLILALRK